MEAFLQDTAHELLLKALSVYLERIIIQGLEVGLTVQ
jgi:hypothetical protein